MHRISTIRLPRPAALVLITLALAGSAMAQVPSSNPTMSPMAPAAGTATSGADFEVVRQAIAQQDFTAARAALDAIKQSNPTDPKIALYESMLERTSSQGQSAGGQSPVRTPRAGVTPAPTPVPTATPVPTTVPTPLPPVSDASSSVISTGGTFDSLKKNPYVFYGAIALAALILIGMGVWIAKRRGRNKYAASSAPSDLATGTASYGLAGNDNYGLDTGAGLSAAPMSTDYGLGSPQADTGAYGNTDAPLGSGEPLGGAALTAGSFTMPSFGVDEEEEAPRPKPVHQPKPVEDEGPVNIFDEVPSAATPPPAASSLSSAADVGPSFSMAMPDEETKILPAQSLSNTTPSSTPSLPGNVDLEDIFGSQPLPGSAEAQAPKLDPMNDDHSHTLSTFVSSPNADNPEESAEGRPPHQLRQSAPAESETQSISFDELFGSENPPDVTYAPVDPTPAAAPKADLPSAIDDANLEDMLVASFADPGPEFTVGDASEPVVADSGPAENLDERSERMFREQMDKAHHAIDEKNWRQAVHFLSIASALHPENEEAKQLLKDARTEKRNSEESV